VSEHTDRPNPKPPSVDRLSQLWRRINDHKMVQWSVGYVALAYGVQHGVELTSDAFEWPHAVVRFSMLLLVLGLPVVITFAWYHGELASRHFTRAELSILSALLVIGSLLFYALVQPSAEVAAGPKPAAEEASVLAAHVASASIGSAISIAVLPFTNLSSDKEQEFFSDGMTEEITAALAKVPDLRVVARTSAFQFKAQNRDIQSIGQQLHATHFTEGSVRKQGDRVRITAQLIKADDGTHIWAEDYDRQLTEIFAIQEDIARAITTSLRMPLGLKPGGNLVNNRSIDPEAHQQYLRARALVQGRLSGGLKALKDAIGLLEQVVDRNPDFAPAWALLASAQSTLPNYSVALTNSIVPVDEIRRAVQSSRDNAEPEVRKAIQLDPDLADGYLTLAKMQSRAGKFLLAEELYFKVLALDPNNTEALDVYGEMLAELGYVKKALAMAQQGHTLEPFLPFPNRTLALSLWLNGEDDAALAIFKNKVVIARVHAGAGRFNEAADALSSLSAPAGSSFADSLEEAVRLLRLAPKTVAAPENSLPPALDFVYLFVGAPGKVLEYYERNVEAGWMANAQTALLWHPSYAPARKTERFKSLMLKGGFVDYWRAKGWPELFCHPTTGDDFECN
jgi:TolB-like protein